MYKGDTLKSSAQSTNLNFTKSFSAYVLLIVVLLRKHV